MNSVYWFKKPKPPTPLEVATGEFVAAQLDLLAAHREAENANGTVRVLEKRIERLHNAMRDLANPPPPESEVLSIIRSETR